MPYDTPQKTPKYKQCCGTNQNVVCVADQAQHSQGSEDTKYWSVEGPVRGYVFLSYVFGAIETKGEVDEESLTEYNWSYTGKHLED